VKNKDSLMRGTCVQAIIELMHTEKRREEVTCVSTDFYSLLMENKFTEAKKLLHSDEGNWMASDKSIATTLSRILIIPCHAIMNTGAHHWFLTLRIKIKKGKHQVIVIDSQGKKSGNGYMQKLRNKLKQVNLITKKDNCNVLDTIDQTENECGIRMASYMVMLRSMDIQHIRDEEIIRRIKRYVAGERKNPKTLAAYRRLTLHRLLENEQAEMKK
jgi:hypothetical protein